jgi:hypothetical protein
MKLVSRAPNWLSSKIVPLVLALGALGGCASQHYAGGPTSEEPHATLNAEEDVTVWAVDGYETTTRDGVRVAPGKHMVRVRLEYPMEGVHSESPTPREYQQLDLDLKAGHSYLIMRKETERPPYEVVVIESVD